LGINNTYVDEAADNLRAIGTHHRLYWFVDSSYAGSSEPGIALSWTPSHAGHYTVVAVDDQGRTTSRPLEVEWVD
jgi:penicillin-binding protein 1C